MAFDAASQGELRASSDVSAYSSSGGEKIAQPIRRTWFPERNSLRLLSIAILILGWEIASLHLRPLFLPSPGLVASSFVHLYENGQLGGATLDSLYLLLVGFGISLIVGVPIGVLAGRSEVANHLTESLITIFWSTPAIALLPLLIIWFGITFETQTIIVVLSAVFPIILATTAGVRDADPNLLAMADIFHARTLDKTRFIILPSAISAIVAGLKVGVGRAIIGVLVAELFTSSTGLGARMSYYGSQFETADYFAALVMFVIFSLIITEAINLLERRFGRWRDQ